MNISEILEAIDELKITQTTLAQLMSVNARTVRRWIANPAKLPKTVEYALQAWLKLNRIGMPWRTDGIDVVPIDLDEIKRIIRYSKDGS